MPNRRPLDPDVELETAHPWGPGRFAEAEPQERRGTPGSRDVGSKPGEHHHRPRQVTDRGPHEWSGVNPLPPIDPAMPVLKPGDQAG